MSYVITVDQVNKTSNKEPRSHDFWRFDFTTHRNQRGRYSPKQKDRPTKNAPSGWSAVYQGMAQRYLHYSWANDYLPLNQLDDCFSNIPRNQEGKMIYVFPADFHEVPLAGGLEKTRHHLAIGYWTDNLSCAKTFLYQRNRKGVLMVTAKHIR